MTLSNHFSFIGLRAAVKTIMSRSRPSDWSVQGFGMMRTYLDPEKVWRLNIWHSSLAVPGVSTIHDHPWNFRSIVLTGKFENVRFAVSPDGPSPNFDAMQIRTGEGGGPSGERFGCTLIEKSREVYLPGEDYAQVWDEIHESKYVDGTVTLNQRSRVGTGEHARVFWPRGEEWVDAEPRAATDAEYLIALGAALKGW